MRLMRLKCEGSMTLPAPASAHAKFAAAGRFAGTTRPRPQPPHAQALAEKATTPPMVERIEFWDGPGEAPAMSSRPTKRFQKSLAIQGTYMIQLRQLESVYLRARSLAAGSTAQPEGDGAKRVQPSQSMQKPRKQLGPPQHQGPRLQSSSSLPLPAALELPQPEHAEAARQASSPAPATLAQRSSHTEHNVCEGSDDLRRSSSSRSSSSSSSAREAALKPGVKDILEKVATTSGNDGSLADILRKVTPVVANQALMALGTEERYRGVQQLVHAMMQAECMNEHSHAVAISALEQAGRFDMAMHHFEDLYRRNIDVGPVCSSVLIKLCAHRRDLPLALDIFYRLSGHSTLNRFTYNCLIHLCAVMGQMDEAINVLRMMNSDESPGTSPDSFTYAELIKALVNSKRWSMLPRLYREIRRSQVQLSSETWSLLITAAGRSSQPDLAKQFYVHAATSMHGSVGHIHNALLSALCRHVPLPEMLHTYRIMLDRGLQPDEYTFNALLTAMSKGGASLYAVEDLIGEMHQWNVKINTFTGTSLISAYRRAPEMMSSDPRTTALLMEKVHDILSQLISQRQANSHAFGTVMSMHGQLGDAGGVQRLLLRMRDAGVALDGKTCMIVAKSFQDGGFEHVAQQFLARTRTKPTHGHGPKQGLRKAW